ncbi:MAG: T9SS type A sorting domain-containing protein [Candidatus Cloacimonetes bacterium]|nr:T9SS type A sorting domain-containing protein [Candidatus Cloacimonadota bacterium]
MRLKMLLPALLIALTLSAVTTSIEVPALSTARNGEYTELAFADGTPAVMDGAPGQPAIPLLSAWVQLPRGTRLVGMNVIPLDEKPMPLPSPPIPLQKPAPLSMLADAAFSHANYAGVLPAVHLHGSGWGRLGEHNVAWAALYSARWDADANTLLAPSAFRLEWITAPDDGWTPRPETAATASMMTALNLSPGQVRTEPSYLVIAPQVWEGDCQPLLDWRRRQGMSTFFRSVESIETAYPGIDLQERIRACITEYYLLHEVSLVTLAADVVFVPDRKLFAFDCEFGAHEDENDLPADIYYAALDGDWDADGDGVYGEDEDEPDWLPELNVGRIPATDSSQLSAYIQRLRDYEQGLHTDYTRALGFSMELWPGAHSYVAQQHIYDMYFDDWDIDFLWGEENTHDNAVQAFCANPNLIQHTGHAHYTVLSLTEGYLTVSDMNALPCDWAGMMYSIGCWSAALDYTSVGETGVTPDSGGLLGYIGNSRYGWGAPGAAGFGFSEFYQKECFRLLLQDDVFEIGALNVQQKLPFVPYYSGTSVYKWCAYQLNALGDVAARLFTHEPLPLEVSLAVHGDTLVVHTHSGGLAVVDAVVTCGDVQQRTDANGFALLPNAAALSGPLSVYAPGYITHWQDDFDPGHYMLPFLGNIATQPVDAACAQGETAEVFARLHNPTTQPLSYTFEAVAADSLTLVQTLPQSGSVPAGESVGLLPVSVLMRSIAEVGQQPDGQPAVVWLRVRNAADSLLCSTPITLHTAAPQIDLHAVNPRYTDNGDIQLACVLVNRGSRTATEVQGCFNSASPHITPPLPFEISTPLQPGQYAQVQRTVSVAATAPPEHIAILELSLTASHGAQSYAFTPDFYLPLTPASYLADFETDPGWEGSDSWQRVTTHAFSGERSLSCRPDVTGTYELATSLFPYVPGAAIAFAYRYRMPMYGMDGVYLLAEHSGTQDTLLFLGAGGALPPGDRDPLVYIESGWAPYEVVLDESMTTPPLAGEMVGFILRFNMGNLIEDFNEYGSMPDIGVFLDDFAWTVDGLVSVEDEELAGGNGLAIWPNPVRYGTNVALHFSLPAAAACELSVFNVRGQRVRGLVHEEFAAGDHALRWDLRDDQGHTVGSGVYLVRLRTQRGDIARKLLLLR